MTIDEILRRCPVMPVVTIDDAGAAPDLARALARGGITIIEVTLRTPAALEAMRRIRAEVPEMLVGAGTVLTPRDYQQSADAGAAFAISPGSTPTLLAFGRDAEIPYLPAICTASELMAAMEHGYGAFKFFPAGAAGGVAALKGLGGLFPQARFCPTGGISLDTAGDYLALPSVLCVGGSWLAPDRLVASRDWTGIEAIAAQTMARLRPGG